MDRDQAGPVIAIAKTSQSAFGENLAGTIAVLGRRALREPRSAPRGCAPCPRVSRRCLAVSKVDGDPRGATGQPRGAQTPAQLLL